MAGEFSSPLYSGNDAFEKHFLFVCYVLACLSDFCSENCCWSLLPEGVVMKNGGIHKKKQSSWCIFFVGRLEFSRQKT